MRLICCVEDRYGLAFNKRRLSSDALVTEDICKRVGEAALWTDPYSAKLFASAEGLQLQVSENPFAEAQTGDYVFVERTDPASEIRTEEPEELLLYHWNRRYPSDVKLTLDLSNWKCMETGEFAGKSHEKITWEILKPQNEEEEDQCE